jgi:hypothetical protein
MPSKATSCSVSHTLGHKRQPSVASAPMSHSSPTRQSREIALLPVVMSAISSPLPHFITFSIINYLKAWVISLPTRYSVSIRRCLMSAQEDTDVPSHADHTWNLQGREYSHLSLYSLLRSLY